MVWCVKVEWLSYRPSLLIKRAALGNLKASFHCTHWHRFFPLKKVFSKTYPSFLTLKEGSTFLTKPLFPQEREDVTALQCYICPTCPSPAGGSLTHSQALALSKRARDVTAPSRCSEPLRSMDGGPKRSSPCYAGWDRLGKACWCDHITTACWLRAPSISEPRCKDTEMVRGNSLLLILAHGCSYFLIDFLCSGVSKPVDYGA